MNNLVTNDPVEAIEAYLQDSGLTIEAKLTEDEFNGHEGQHHFEVVIERNGVTHTVNYSAGCAHRHYPKSLRVRMAGGRPGAPIETVWGRLTIADVERRRLSVPNTPTATDIMSCLVSDAQCVAYGETFEDFAANLGYDEDSRKAERAYHACRETHYTLLRMGFDFEELCELFQDY